jgi:uncharacterized protein
MHEHHAIDYIEFTVPDLARAQRFYAEAFGWRFTEYGPGYVGILGRNGEAGGMHEGTPGGPGGILVILYSDDLEASRAAVEAAGGAIVKAPFSFPGGRRFHVTDPAGNELAVWAEG